MRSLKLLVRSPTDEIPIFEVNCDFGWNVADLKRHLSTVYPTNPPEGSQRIIYAGKLLKDDEALNKFFTSVDEAYVVHLVCRNGSKSVTKSSVVPRMVPSTSSFQGDAPAQPPSQTEMEQYRQYLQNFYLNAVTNCTTDRDGSNSLSQPYSNNDAAGYFPYVGSWPWFYYPWFNFWDTGFHPPNQHVSAPSSGSTNAPATPPADGHVNCFVRGARAVMAELGLRQGGDVAQDENGNEAAVAVGGGDNAQQPQQPMVLGNAMAGAGGLLGAEAANEDGVEVDIVDRFYMLFRLGLFVMLCVFYSSPDKALIVFSIVAYVYFYNIYRRHAANRQVAAVPVPQQQPVDQNRQEPQRVDSSSDGSVSQSASSLNDGEQAVRRQNVGMEPPASGLDNALSGNLLHQENPALTNRLAGTLRSFVVISYQFVSSLITSIIPEQPPPLRLD